MFKKMMLLAMAVMAIAAVSAPAASANWTHSGAPITKDTTVAFDGTASFQGSIGGVHCTNATAAIVATAGTTDGHVELFDVHNPTVNCKVTGFLAVLAGGESSLHDVELTGSPTATISGGVVGITGIVLHNRFTSGLEFNLSGSLTATPNNPKSISSIALSGNLTNSLTGGPVAVSGSLGATPAGTYGIE
jgi:hypothetical protein